MKYHQFALISITIVCIATIIEGLIYKNFLGYAIKNTIELCLIMIGAYIGLHLTPLHKQIGEKGEISLSTLQSNSIKKLKTKESDKE